MGGRYVPNGCSSVDKTLPFSPLSNTQKCRAPQEVWEGWVGPGRRGNPSAWQAGPGPEGHRDGAAAPGRVGLRNGLQRREAEVRDNSMATCFSCG